MSFSGCFHPPSIPTLPSAHYSSPAAAFAAVSARKCFNLALFPLFLMPGKPVTSLLLRGVPGKGFALLGGHFTPQFDRELDAFCILCAAW